MDNTLATSNNDHIIKAAKELYADFLQQMLNPEPKGFVSMEDELKIFSFEKYLREKGHSEQNCYAYCNYIKLDKKDMFTVNRSKRYRVIRYFMITLTPGVILYLLTSALLWTFNISLLKWVPFILFALSLPLLFMLLQLIQYLKWKKEEKSGITKPRFMVKYFDNEDLSFETANGRLYVGK